jgi:hypothetical protein
MKTQENFAYTVYFRRIRDKHAGILVDKCGFKSRRVTSLNIYFELKAELHSESDFDQNYQLDNLCFDQRYVIL